MLTEAEAREIVIAAHRAWSERQLEQVLSFYEDNLLYWCNVGAPDGGPLLIMGKEAFRTSLQSFLGTTRCKSGVHTFEFKDGVAKATAFHRVTHVETGYVLDGSFRQVWTFKSKRIARLDEYHDAARLTAFWRLVAENRRPNGSIWNLENPPAPKTKTAKTIKD